MKKVFTLLAGISVSLAGFAAVPNLDKFGAVEVQASPEVMASIKAADMEVLHNPQITDADYTRTWTDPQGYVWDLSLKCFTQSIGEFFGLSTKDEQTGETVMMDMEKLPYFAARYMLRKLNSAGDGVTDGVIFYFCWPTNYVYKQIFTYDGELVDGDIPLEKREYTPALPSELINDDTFCRQFREAPAAYAGAVMNDERTGWAYYFAVNNDWIGNPGLYNSQDAMTIVDDNTASTVDFRAYELADNSIEARNRIYLSTERVKRATISNTYNGVGDIEGFEPRYVTTEDFGEVHVFNAGAVSSDILGDDNPFTEDFAEYTALFVAAADPAFVWTITPGATKFNSKEIKLALAEGVQGVNNEQFNLILGYMFADPKYAANTAEDPKEVKFRLVSGETAYDPSTKEYYLSIAPELNSFVTAGYNYGWSDDYGVEVDNQNALLVLDGAPNEIAWGTKEGFSVAVHSQFDRFVNTKSTKDIIYHYDPTDMNKTRTFSSFGSLDPSEVEAIVAENGVQVIARDGMIVVNAAQKAPVAIFTLDGKLVKAVEAENVAVEAAKGVYVVRVGDKAQKVVL